MTSTRDAEVELIGVVRSVTWFLGIQALPELARITLTRDMLKAALEKVDQAREQAWPKLPEYRREEGGQDDK